MAQYVIPPKTAIVKCGNCATLYVPDRSKDDRWFNGDFDAFEKCPVCGYRWNKFENTIPLWRYNLIKWKRGGFRKKREEDDGDG